jgi:hypothetical protein
MQCAGLRYLPADFPETKAVFHLEENKMTVVSKLIHFAIEPKGHQNVKSKS